MKLQNGQLMIIRQLDKKLQVLNMKLVYGFVPIGGSLEDMIEKRAYEIALKIVKRTSVTMSLEDQENTSERLKLAVDEITPGWIIPQFQ